MKITDIELHEIHPPLQAWNRDAHRLFQGTTWDTRTIVVLHTDSGLEGLGETLGAVEPALEQELVPAVPDSVSAGTFSVPGEPGRPG